MNIKHRWRLHIGVGAVIALLLAPATTSALGAISQGFKTSDTTTPVGSLVSLEANKQSFIQLATSDKANQLVGIIAQKPLVALGDGTQQAQVVVSGLTSTLVSNINGDVRVGDKITASPLRGIGMKALTSSEIVGIAQSNLSDAATSLHAVTDKAGKTTQVKIGSISLQVNVSYYAAPQNKLDSIVPAFLVNFGSAVAGKDVSPLRVLLGFMALLVGFLLVGTMLQAAIRSGIISIGRNPLAHSALRQSLIDVLVTAIGLLLITSIVFYVILTL